MSLTEPIQKTQFSDLRKLSVILVLPPLDVLVSCCTKRGFSVRSGTPSSGGIKNDDGETAWIAKSTWLYAAARTS